MKEKGTQLIQITSEEYREYLDLKRDKNRHIIDDDKMIAFAEKVASILTDRGYLISEQQYREYESLRASVVDELLSGVEAARIMGCSPSSITRLASSGKLEMIRVGNVNKYTRKGILRYMDKRRVVPIKI